MFTQTTLLETCTTELRTTTTGRATGLVSVPRLARVLGTVATPAEIRDALLTADRDGTLELRPESGMGRLSASDASLCPKGFDGAPLSWVRIVGGGAK